MPFYYFGTFFPSQENACSAGRSAAVSGNGKN